MFTNKLKPIHLIILFSSMIALLVVVIVVQQVNIALNPVTISKVPSDAKLYVNGKEVSGERTNLANGTYVVTAKKDGFSDFTTTAVIDDDSKYIVVALAPESEDAKKWAEQNQNLYLEQESKAGKQAAEAGGAFAAKNPIVGVLPINNYTYNVGYKLDQRDTSGKSIIITVDAYEGYRNAAIRSISELGFDPGDYNIEFDNYTNPFTTDRGVNL